MRLSKKVEHAARPNEKRPGFWRGRLIMCTPGAAQTKQELQRAYLRCLRALGAVFDFKLNFRSEEHTSELQSLMRISYAVFCLKKKHQKVKQAVHNDLYIDAKKRH